MKVFLKHHHHLLVPCTKICKNSAAEDFSTPGFGERDEFPKNVVANYRKFTRETNIFPSFWKNISFSRKFALIFNQFSSCFDIRFLWLWRKADRQQSNDCREGMRSDLGQTSHVIPMFPLLSQHISYSVQGLPFPMSQMVVTSRTIVDCCVVVAFVCLLCISQFTMMLLLWYRACCKIEKWMPPSIMYHKDILT